MSTPYHKGIQVGSIRTVVNNSLRLYNISHQTHLEFKDFYESDRKKFGIERDEMLVVMPQIMTVDTLVGADCLEYL
jgi:hypothetical protein